jgi:hypothetical protein
MVLEMVVKLAAKSLRNNFVPMPALANICGTKDGMNMTRITRTWIVPVVLAAIAAILAIGQVAAAQTSGTVTASQPTTTSEPSLGNYARALKKDKKQEAAKKFDNDNLPREDKLSVVGPAADSADSANAAPDQQAAPADAAASTDKMKNTPASVTPGETPEQRQQVYDQWKEKLSSQQTQIDALSHELDLEQREYKLRAAEFYGDAGERLRNQSGWDKEDAKYKDQIAEKQKALDDAKQKLDAMQEDARKAGVPTSQRGDDQQPQQ